MSHYLKILLVAIILLDGELCVSGMSYTGYMSKWIDVLHSFYESIVPDYRHHVQAVEKREIGRRSFYGSGSGSGSGSGDDIVIPTDPTLRPYSKCVKEYVRHLQDGVDLPPYCPPLPLEADNCTCPDPDEAKRADSDVILDELNIEAKVFSQYVNVSVEGILFNPHDGVQLAELIVRLPQQAFISHFHITVNDEDFVAKIEEKEKAAMIFEDAVNRGTTAATVEARGKNEFSTSVAVSRRCRMRFKLHYEYLVERVIGEFSVPIQVTPSIPAITRRLRIYLHDHNPLSCVKVGNQGVYQGIVFDRPSEFEATLDTELDVDQENDFVLTYDVTPTQVRPGKTLVDPNGYMFISYILPSTNCKAYQQPDDTCRTPTYSTMMTANTIRQPPTHPLPVCIVFVLDVSGSMYGQKLDQAKASLIQIVTTCLSNDSYIGIVLFDSDVQYLTGTLVKVNPKVLVRLIRYIRAGGYTNINLGLQKGMEMLKSFFATQSTDFQCIPMLVLMTDGYPTSGVTNPNRIVSLQESRVEKYNTDIGTPVQTHYLGFGTNQDLDFNLIQDLAANTNGSARRIYRGSDVEQQLLGFCKEIACPTLCNVAIRYKDEAAIANITEQDISHCYFEGSQVYVAAKLQNAQKRVSSENVVLRGISVDGRRHLKSSKVLESRDVGIPDGIIERTFAYLTVRQLLNKRQTVTGNDKTVLENEIKRIALEYQFVTPLTSLVVVKPCDSQSRGGLDSVDEEGHDDGRTTQPTSVLPTTGLPVQPSSVILPASPGVTSDPHFLVGTQSGVSLCYSLKGTEGEVYNLLTDTEFSINGLLIGTVFKGVAQTYFGSISLVHQRCSEEVETRLLFTADHGLVVIGEGGLSWGQNGGFHTRDGQFKITMNQSIAEVTTHTELGPVQFAVLRSELNCTHYTICSRKYYLGFYVPDTTGLSVKTHGMLGQFLKQQVSCDGDHVILSNGKEVKVKPFHRLNSLAGQYQKCWATDHYGIAFLDGTPTDYLMREIYDTEYVFSKYNQC